MYILRATDFGEIKMCVKTSLGSNPKTSHCFAMVGHSPRGCKYGWDKKNARFSTNIWLYIGNDTRCAIGYYGTTIKTLYGNISNHL